MILPPQVNLSHGGSDAALNICPPGNTLLLYGQEESIRYISLHSSWYTFGASVNFFMCMLVVSLCENVDRYRKCVLHLVADTEGSQLRHSQCLIHLQIPLHHE